MPETSQPNYSDVVSKPVWQNGSDVNTFGQRRVKPGVDEIKASDLNSLRDAIDLMWSHTHNYTDSVGRC